LLPLDSVALFTLLGELKRVFPSIARGVRRRQTAEVAALFCQKNFLVEEGARSPRWNRGSDLCGFASLRQLRFRRSATQIRMRSPVLTKARGPPDAASGVTCGTMVPCCLLSGEHIEFRFAPKSRRLAEIPSRSFGANAETMRSPRITSTWRGLEPLAMALGLTPAHVDRGNRGPVRRSRQLLGIVSVRHTLTVRGCLSEVAPEFAPGAAL
jgi:hypothetical protein